MKDKVTKMSHILSPKTAIISSSKFEQILADLHKIHNIGCNIKWQNLHMNRHQLRFCLFHLNSHQFRAPNRWWPPDVSTNLQPLCLPELKNVVKVIFVGHGANLQVSQHLRQSRMFFSQPSMFVKNSSSLSQYFFHGDTPEIICGDMYWFAEPAP